VKKRYAWDAIWPRMDGWLDALKAMPLRQHGGKEYNTVRPHSSLDYRPPEPEAIMPLHFGPFWLSSSQENITQILT